MAKDKKYTGLNSRKKDQPMTEENYFNRIIESRKAIKEGKLITQEQAIAYFKIKGRR